MSEHVRWHRKEWRPSLDWTTPTGQLLQQAAEILGERIVDRSIRIVVFGSSPLQMGVSRAITSGDVDIACDQEIQQIFMEAQLSKGQSSPYIEVCPLGTFRTAPDWERRSYEVTVGKVLLVFPHPIDILVSKVRRGEEKDFEAFEEVIKAEGHPTEEELRDALVRAVHLYKPGFDESVNGDPIYNTQALWERLFGRNIDVRGEIIIPGNEAKQKSRPPE